MEENQLEGGIERRHDFPTTLWSMVTNLGHTDTAEAAPALERLCRAYWYPLYTFVRRSGYDPHQAEDLTQGFFFHLFKNNAFRHVDREKGRFRTFLLAAMRNYLTNEWDKRTAQKRGDPHQIISWDAIKTEELYREEPPDIAAPEQVFDRRWAFVLVNRVLDRLRKEYTDAGKEPVFERLQAHLTADVEPGVHKAAAG